MIESTDHADGPTQTDRRRTSSETSAKNSRCRNLVAFWILGLCNNYGYVVMLSAAHDILQSSEPSGKETEFLSNHTASNNSRDCNQISTGAILLADILPSLIIKLTAPFLPFFVSCRVGVVIGLSAAGYLLVALASTKWLAIIGVMATSLGSGLGEVTLLSYSAGFDKNVISTWSSGTGGAGILGSFSYSGLIDVGMSPRNALLLMLSVPVLMGIAFWIILKHPKKEAIQTDSEVNQQDAEKDSLAEAFNLQSFSEKLKIVPSLYIYMIPIGLVYLLEYFINQGLFELVEYQGIWLTHAQQYRWLQVDYQIGVFISRSSVNFVTIDRIWLMAVLQFVNVVLFLFHVIYFYIPNIWMIFALVLWEGLLGGAAYVNTFYRMSKEVPKERREFSMGLTSLADSLGIALAGFIAIPVHNAICKLPKPSNFIR